ncbi:hypothetical protein HMF7854_14465 [Sphingomonas ginkgonis]|uniref:Uncharacterized protein n=2 Tax=Sphingomonas ginkgonis TaxID=2315330 RepID=A0A429VD25_9SPHN|nr:hypothetical protein HMF7854_14465 [Sphingomonas ginkgonis]
MDMGNPQAGSPEESFAAWLAELEVALRQAGRTVDHLLAGGVDSDTCHRLRADIARARCHAGALQLHCAPVDRKANEPFWSELLRTGDRRRR